MQQSRFLPMFSKQLFQWKAQTAPEAAMTLNSSPKKNRLKNNTLKPYAASKNDILKLSEPPTRHIFPGVPTLGDFVASAWGGGYLTPKCPGSAWGGR